MKYKPLDGTLVRVTAEGERFLGFVSCSSINGLVWIDIIGPYHGNLTEDNSIPDAVGKQGERVARSLFRGESGGMCVRVTLKEITTRVTQAERMTARLLGGEGK